MAAVLEVLFAFLRLGLTSFGGPIAHLGYFREEFVVRRRWLSEESYAHTVALCQFLPGPASSQVGIILGYRRAGAPGALAAWCGFTLPSAIALVAFAYGLHWFPGAAASGYVHGLLVAAVAVVALAVASMANSLAPDRVRRTLAVAVAAGALLAPANGYAQLALIALGALFGSRFLRTPAEGAVRAVSAATATAAAGAANAANAANAASAATAAPAGDAARTPGAAEPELDEIRGDPRAGYASAAAFLALVVGLPIAEHAVRFGPFVAFAKFFEVGALVFGGGHVVLPLLQAQVVPPGWITNASFIAGYGAAQAVPGPLFTFAAYLGAAMERGPVHGVGGAALTLVAIFLPSFLLIAAVLPFWERLRRNAAAGAVLRGVNAAVVGVLLAALYSPVWVNAIRSTLDVALALAAFVALGTWRAPPWSVVLGSALLCGLLER